MTQVDPGAAEGPGGRLACPTAGHAAATAPSLPRPDPHPLPSVATSVITYPHHRRHHHHHRHRHCHHHHHCLLPYHDLHDADDLQWPMLINIKQSPPSHDLSMTRSAGQDALADGMSSRVHSETTLLLHLHRVASRNHQFIRSTVYPCSATRPPHPEQCSEKLLQSLFEGSLCPYRTLSQLKNYLFSFVFYCGCFFNIDFASLILTLLL